ncbi:MAG: alpha/beta hydrolase [Firmicutes bacterium]|nr:alpha/beta hydrolase [Bacillota bacterium]
MSSDFPLKRVAIRENVPMAYMEVNTGEDPIIWIHGMGAYRESFHGIFVDPPVPGRHLAVDLPGFGHSGHWRRVHTLRDYVHALLDFMDALSIARAVLVGHSFGGMVAGETVVAAPERIQGALFVSSAGWMAPENALKPTPSVLLNRAGIWITGLDFFGRRMLAALGVAPEQLDPEDRRRFRWGWRHAYEMARMGQFYESPQFAERVLAAGRPLALIHGERDLLFPLARLRAVVGERAPLWVIPGAGHVPFYSHPAEFRQVFQAAYASLADTPRNGSR